MATAIESRSATDWLNLAAARKLVKSANGYSVMRLALIGEIKHRVDGGAIRYSRADCERLAASSISPVRSYGGRDDD